MFCNNCGTVIPDDVKFCQECGNKVKEVVEETDTCLLESKKVNHGFGQGELLAYKNRLEFINKKGVKTICYFKDMVNVTTTMGTVFTLMSRTGKAYSFGVIDGNPKEWINFVKIRVEEEGEKTNNNSNELNPLVKKVLEKQEEKSRLEQLKKDKIPYCPKCHSTSLSANKKGFGFVKGALGMGLSVDIGMLAGGAGANKIILTCMNCGHKFKPGKNK